MKFIISAFLFIFLISGNANALKKPNSLTGEQVQTENALFAAIVKQEKVRRQIALELATVKSKNDLQTVLETSSPLDLLTDAAKERFTSSMTFGENGITSFDYSDLEAELTPTQIHSVLTLFGAQHTVSKLQNARIESSADLLLLNNQVTEVKLTDPGYSTMSFEISDHKGYWCVSRATCAERQGSICMSSC